MATKAIDRHPAIGLRGKCKNRTGTIIAVKRAAGLIFNRKTMVGTNENFIRIKFQPDDGGRAFWSKPIVWKE